MAEINQLSHGACVALKEGAARHQLEVVADEVAEQQRANADDGLERSAEARDGGEHQPDGHGAEQVERAMPNWPRKEAKCDRVHQTAPDEEAEDGDR
jgi:hypothetical protein